MYIITLYKNTVKCNEKYKSNLHIIDDCSNSERKIKERMIDLIYKLINSLIK